MSSQGIGLVEAPTTDDADVALFTSMSLHVRAQVAQVGKGLVTQFAGVGV